MGSSELDQLCVNTIRTLSIDGVQKANSGHPGLPLGAAPMAYALWQRQLRFDAQDPHWADRDRFVLSAGHGSMLLYSLLHLYGFPLTIDDLKSFRQWGSKTPGHPEAFITAGVDATTGPLGQGTANAVGMAITERFLAARYNKPGHTIVDHDTYCVVGDGCLMEGISSEAASLAGHLKLGKLTMLYDSNDVSLDGPTSLSFTGENVAKRYEAYGWHVQLVKDGDHDLDAISKAIAAAKAETGKPSLIIVKTTIGFGSPHKAGTSEAHGSPLGPDEVAATKKAFGWDPEKFFFVPDAAKAEFANGKARGAKSRTEWNARFAAWSKAYPDLAREWTMAQKGELPADLDASLPQFPAGEKLATRQSSGKALNAIAAKVPWFLGGDADLSVSTNTRIKDAADFNGTTGEGRNVRFGVREHAMGAIANGMCWHGGVRPFVSTFFVFTDYLRPSLRLAALNHLPVIGVYTHDSIMLGEDGPTHQPIEHLQSLRVMPNCHVVRPCDSTETAEAWSYAMKHTTGPTVLALSRQAVPNLDRTQVASAKGLHKGAYVLSEAKGGVPKVILIGTGTEVHLALAAKAELEAKGVATRVVSMPCCEAFDKQDANYRESVLPKAVTARVSIECGATRGWERYVGLSGRMVGIDRFGASAPAGTLAEHFGFTVAHVVAAATATLG